MFCHPLEARASSLPLPVMPLDETLDAGRRVPRWERLDTPYLGARELCRNELPPKWSVVCEWWSSVPCHPQEAEASSPAADHKKMPHLCCKSSLLLRSLFFRAVGGSSRELSRGARPLGVASARRIASDGTCTWVVGAVRLTFVPSPRGYGTGLYPR